MLHHHCALDVPPREPWLLPGLIPTQGLVVIASAPKTGKTVLVNAIARAMASGGEFADVSWEGKIPVAWCAHEETLQERAPLLAGLKPDDPFYIGMPEDLPFLDDLECDNRFDRYGRFDENRIPYVYHLADRLKVRLLVIDCLHAAVRASNLADNQVARRIMGKLRHWTQFFNVATVVLHHLTKSAHRGYHPERFADSSQILATASCYFFMESEILEDGNRRIVLTGAGRQPPPPARQEFLATSLFDYEYVRSGHVAQRLPTATLIRNLLEEAGELTAKQIAARLGIKHRTVQTTLARMPDVTSDPTRKAHRYTLDPTLTPDP